MKNKLSDIPNFSLMVLQRQKGGMAGGLLSGELKMQNLFEVLYFTSILRDTLLIFEGSQILSSPL